MLHFSIVWGLAGHSPEGAVKITGGGWDVTSAGKPERMVRDTEEMQRVLKHGAPEEGEVRLSPCQLGQDVMNLNCSLKGHRHLCALFKVQPDTSLVAPFAFTAPDSL